IPFEFIAAESLTPERLADLRVLGIPNAPGLTVEQVRTIEAFVADGGSLVAARDAGLVSANGDIDMSLGDVLGVRINSAPRGPVKNNYIALTDRHPVSDGYEGAQRIVGGTHLIGVEAVE